MSFEGLYGFPRNTDVPETEVPDGCPQDGGSRQKSPRRTTGADWHRRMSLKRKVKTDEPAVLAFLSQTSMCAICLGLTFRRRMSQADVPETDDRDGGPRRMPQTDVPKSQDQDEGKVRVCVSVCLCLSVYMPACLPACMSVCLSVCFLL